MISYTKKIREAASRILNESKVDMVIGFTRGSMPTANKPCFITNHDETSNLIWDSRCDINLANYLINRKEKIGIVVKGCDSRNIVTLILENKILRSQLYIIGIPCNGMIDKKKIKNLIKEEINEISEANDTISVKTTKNKNITFEKKTLLNESCISCNHHNPVIYDEIIDKPIEEQENIDLSSIRNIEKMSSENKNKYFDNLLSSCIRCYACKNTCPLCYCPVCFVDESKPQWLGKGQNKLDIKTFHFLRAYHCGGRCTNCGACERACPLGIQITMLTRKLEKDCKEQFNWISGISTEHRPLLDSYKQNDPEEFISK